ncbi:hypothetical protein J4E08_21830 [Sagittula sp. NFXS13]|uniref:hypothetical protein n=1 Tax=Sagittula sp. NFXS13 TaxID=2819095 RepID=UPI0032DF2398
MDYEPELIFRQPAIADDLGRAAAWCRFNHRCTPAYTLVAVAYLVDGQAVVLLPDLAERELDFDEGPILQTATSALEFLGYRTSLSGWSRSSPGTIVFEASLSAHARLAAIKCFRGRDLPGLE